MIFAFSHKGSEHFIRETSEVDSHWKEVLLELLRYRTVNDISILYSIAKNTKVQIPM